MELEKGNVLDGETRSQGREKDRETALHLSRCCGCGLLSRLARSW